MINAKEKELQLLIAVDAWAAANSLRLDAVLRHWSQSIVQRRSWIPKDLCLQKPRNRKI